MDAGEGPFETVDTMLLGVVYFGVPASFIVVRQVLMKCKYLSLSTRAISVKTELISVLCAFFAIGGHGRVVKSFMRRYCSGGHPVYRVPLPAAHIKVTHQ